MTQSHSGMDISGLVLTGLGIGFEVASVLYGYGRDVKSARKEICELSSELFGLIGVLDHLKAQHGQSSSLSVDNKPPAYDDLKDISANGSDERTASDQPGYREDIASMLKQTIDLLSEMHKALAQPKNKIKSAVQRLAWPLQEREAKKFLTRLERIKSYFILYVVIGEADQSRKLADEIVALRAQVQDLAIGQQAAEFREYNNKRARVQDLTVNR